VKTAEKLVDKIGTERLEFFLREGIPARAFNELYKALL
jgi:hypothetical protein